MVHTFNPSTLEAEAVDLCEFEASLIYIVSSRAARAVTYRSPFLKNRTEQNKTKQNKKTKQTN